MFTLGQQNYPANQSQEDKSPPAVPVPEGDLSQVLGPQQGTDDQVLLTADKSPRPKATTSSDDSARRHNVTHQHSSLSGSATD